MERNFFSRCFAIATGVGKTRLMGAFIAFFHLHKGINNFFFLVPNLTIYKEIIWMNPTATAPLPD